MASLRESKDIANNLRFSSDIWSPDKNLFGTSGEIERNFFFQHDLEITKNITPKLDYSIAEVCRRLHLPRSEVLAFVSSSPLIQAACYINSKDVCLLKFSSSLVNLLTVDEFKFVVGHEIGHFLLEHNAYNYNSSNLEFFEYSQRQEISADRVGLIGCKNLNFAASALIKTLSGLNSQHIKLDVGHFISQKKRIKDNKVSQAFYSSHPTAMTRTRALILFYTAHESQISHDRLQRKYYAVDTKIEKELAITENREREKQITYFENEFAIWFALSLCLVDSRFKKEEQKIFSNEFGSDVLLRIKRLLETETMTDIKNLIDEKLCASQQSLEKLLSTNYSNIIEAKKNEISKLFS